MDKDITQLFKSFRTEAMGSRTPYHCSFDQFTEPFLPHSASFGEAPREYLDAELSRRFDFVVSMNDQRTCEKGKSVATYGLCGCIGGYIENQTSNTLFHYDPTSTPIINLLISQHVTKDTIKVHFFVPGTWVKDSAGKYTMQPKKEYSDRLLHSALNSIKATGVEVELHSYSEARSIGARYQGTVWINSDGALFAEGMPIKVSPRPQAGLKKEAISPQV